MYKVIDGKKIGLRYEPEFIRGGLSEKDFYEFVKASQDYFIKGDLEDRETIILGKSAYAIWVDRARCVEVEDLGDGTYKVTNNGNHRACVANKYNLKILVYVDDYM